jgi:hypothetical protein
VPPAKPTVKPKLSEIDALLAAALSANVDELGALEREFAPLKFKIDRIDVLRRAIREHYASKPGDAVFMASGEKFCVSVGMKSRERTLHVGKLIKLIGARLFNSIATVTQKALEAEVPGAVIDECTTYALTGFRGLKVFEKGL